MGRSAVIKVLASPSRVLLLHELQQADGPLTVDDLVERSGLSASAVREHLARLGGAGLVTSAPERRTTRGRPRVLYSPVARAAGESLDPRLRALLLEASARRCGTQAAHLREGAAAQLAALETHLDDLGMQPRTDVAALEVHLHDCPFLPLAQESTAMVCSVHLAVADGVLRRAGGPLRADRLEPFVGPSHCVLGLADRPP